MLYPILSLVFLAVAIAIGCIFKKNTGIVSIALALILARIAGVPDKFLLKAFDSSLFIKLLGVMFLFCIAQNNQTLEIIARKALMLCRGKVKLIPIVLFFFSAIVSFIGPGLISATALVSVLAIALAIEADVEVFESEVFSQCRAAIGYRSARVFQLAANGQPIGKAIQSLLFRTELDLFLLIICANERWCLAVRSIEAPACIIESRTVIYVYKTIACRSKV